MKSLPKFRNLSKPASFEPEGITGAAEAEKVGYS